MLRKLPLGPAPPLELLLLIGCLSCSAATIAPNVAGGIAEASASSSLTRSPSKRMLFGGASHRTYLGCVSCSAGEADSIFNPNGRYGSRSSAMSVQNPSGEFGSPFSTFSACDPDAADPPLIIDEERNFYGRLTLNPRHPERTRNKTLRTWLVGVCRQSAAERY